MYVAPVIWFVYKNNVSPSHMGALDMTGGAGDGGRIDICTVSYALTHPFVSCRLRRYVVAVDNIGVIKGFPVNSGLPDDEYQVTESAPAPIAKIVALLFGQIPISFACGARGTGNTFTVNRADVSAHPYWLIATNVNVPVSLTVIEVLVSPEGSQ